MSEDAPSGSDAQSYIDGIARARGYVLDYHKLMAANDYKVMEAANGLVDHAYLNQRRLDKKTKELLFILSLTVIRAPKDHIIGHIRVALAAGADPEEILEAIEIALPEAGIVAFQVGLEAWAEVVDAPRLEPSPDLVG